MRRAVDLEIRLSYYDRILKTLPEPMQHPDIKMVPTQAPGPDYEYDDPGMTNTIIPKPYLPPTVVANAYHDAAQTVLNLIRGRAKADDVISHLQGLKNSLETTDDTNVDSLLCSIAVQSLLHIGSRSFSHFLNAIERYLPLLRNLAGGGISSGGSPNFEARRGILDAVIAFWKYNKYMIVIVCDKLMQYQIVDPTDVVAWTFLHGRQFVSTEDSSSLEAYQWQLIKGALDKANGRVVIARKRVAALRKEEDDNAARAKANDQVAMEVDAEAKPGDIPSSQDF